MNRRTIPIAIILFFMAFSVSAHSAGRKALVIGNLDYADTGRFLDLRTTRSDAQVMAELFRKGGFVVSDPVLDGSRIEMEDALATFADTLEPGDEAVVYFAGHGVQYQNKVWLMGTNAEFRFKAKLGEDAISHEFIANLLGGKGVRIAVILLDCCREAPDQSWLASSMQKRGLRSAQSETHAHLNPPPNILVGYATSSLRLTNDMLSEDDKNGPLVSSLARHWNGGDEFDVLWKKVTRDVYGRSLKVAAKYSEVEVQMPSKYGQTIHDFFFTEGEAVEKPGMVSSAAKVQDISKGFTNSLGMKMIPVEGTDVLFCEHETRVQDFAAFVEATGYSGGEDPVESVDEWLDFQYREHEQGPDHPVVNVSWNDAKAFCEWLSKKEGKDYRLPTDHEWSVAVGIGDRESAKASPKDKNGKIEGVYPWGTTWPPPSRAGNFNGTESAWIFQDLVDYTDGHPFTAPVGSYKKTRDGLSDLSGNAQEWCEEWISSSQELRVLRGGSWRDGTKTILGASFRDGVRPTNREGLYGFRVIVDAGS